VLAVATGLQGFCAGLTIIVLGTGLLKPNIAALVAELYPEGGSRRDAGFTLFYMSINLGAFFGPLVTALLAERYGWHVGFLAAAVGMTAGVAWFWLTRARLGDAGLLASATGAQAHRERTFAWCGGLALLLVLAAAGFGLLPVSAVVLQGGAIYVILALCVLYFVYLFAFAGLDARERRHLCVLLALFAASTVFWSGFEQAGSSLNLFAERHTQRLIGSFAIPAGWFQSLNSTFIIIFAPLFSMLWIALARSGRDLSAAAKFVIGLLGMGGGFLAMAAAAAVVANGELAAPYWLVLTYLLHTFGELALSPVGMSATSQLVPRRFVCQSMGLWYTTLALGNLLASRIAGEFDAGNLGAMPGQYLRIWWYGAIAAAVLFAALPLIRRASR
jgi:POT family proton-dependent oligopeptide transporter